MISRELMNKVLDSTDIISISIVKNTVRHNGFYNAGSINIHELAHKCKEWAWSKHLVTIRSGYAENGAWSNMANDNSVSFCSMDIPLTEPEAIFNACQWILDNKCPA